MTVPDPTALSAAELAAALRSGTVTSVQAVEAFLARIARLNPAVRAVVRLHPAAARRAAAAADSALAAGKPLGPLHGLPMTVKDGFRVAGSPTTFGLPGTQFGTVPGDCELVRRLRAAGAIIMGRTAVPLAMFDWQCRTPMGRECLNPLDRRRTPGGSSGGAAAALAARLTPLELGSDLAGSIRYPAHCCGVVALRTSLDLLPTADTGPDGRTNPSPSAVAAGPMARTLDDLLMLAEVLLADDDRGRAPPRPAGDRLRVAVLPQLAELPTDRATAAASARFAGGLRAAGHAVTVLDRPPFDFAAAYDLWGRLVGYEMRRAMPTLLRAGPVARAAAHLAVTVRLGGGPLCVGIARGVRGSEADYRGWLSERDAVRAAVARFFERFDLWALPVSPSAAITRVPRGRPIAGRPYTEHLGTYLCPTVVPGTPALTLPIGWDEAGLPVGAQVHAARFADRWLVRVAADLFSPPARG